MQFPEDCVRTLKLDMDTKMSDVMEVGQISDLTSYVDDVADVRSQPPAREAFDVTASRSLLYISSHGYGGRLTAGVFTTKYINLSEVAPDRGTRRRACDAGTPLVTSLTRALY
jgi:hypothetical protein